MKKENGNLARLENVMISMFYQDFILVKMLWFLYVK